MSCCFGPDLAVVFSLYGSLISWFPNLMLPHAAHKMTSRCLGWSLRLTHCGCKRTVSIIFIYGQFCNVLWENRLSVERRGSKSTNNIVIHWSWDLREGYIKLHSSLLSVTKFSFKWYFNDFSFLLEVQWGFLKKTRVPQERKILP